MSTFQTLVLPVRNTVILPRNIMPLTVGRERSRKVITQVQNQEDPTMVLVTQRDEDIDHPDPSDLYDVGVKVKVLKTIQTQKDAFNVFVQGLERVRVDDEDYQQTSPYLQATAHVLETTDSNDLTDPETVTREKALIESLQEMILEEIDEIPSMPEEVLGKLDTIEDAGDICDFLVGNLQLDIDEKQSILETPHVIERLEATMQAVDRMTKVSEIKEEVQKEVLEETEKRQRRQILKQQQKVIQEQLGENGDLDELEEKVHEKVLPPNVEEQALKQIDRLRAMQASSSEYSVNLDYVRKLVEEIPWYTKTDDNLDLERARNTLEEDHYGMEDVKDRILEDLSVQELQSQQNSPILCLVGPPGTGKTSIAKSIARSMGRRYRRISLGGIYNESAIRGHRRTYVGALPGKIVRALINAGTMNPLIVLDEIDKIGNDFRGDPEAAMLEVLDPEQNQAFEDHFVEEPIDLSDVFFLATANYLEDISEPLKDRMEIIQVPSYTGFEKKKIAEQHLVPKQVGEHNISPDHLTITDEAMEQLIERYTREAGVRSLERRIGDVTRKIATDVASSDEEERDDVHVTVDEDFLLDRLGPPKYHSRLAQRSGRPGVATGLAWTKTGGDILFVETSMMNGSGELTLTGSLGDVLQESAEIAYNYIKTHAPSFGLKRDFDENIDFHIHVPEGAVPTDGPSAGITIFSSLLSALKQAYVPEEIAMTGEITLRGDVLKVGGIKEKVTAAHRNGIEEVILPELCRSQLDELHDTIQDDLTFHFVSQIKEVADIIFEEETFVEDEEIPLFVPDDIEHEQAH